MQIINNKIFFSATGIYKILLSPTFKQPFSILTIENEVDERQKTHFEEILNRPESEITAEPELRRKLELDI